MAGNLCRCGAYPKIERAILRASRAGGRMMAAARQQSQREMEGRFEDVWVLVDEDDDLETWADGAELDVVGKPATRHDGLLRTSGGGALHGRHRAPRDAPRAGAARAGRARCRVTGLDLEAARATPGSGPCSGRTGRSRCAVTRLLTAEPGYAGAADRGRRGRHAGGGRGGDRRALAPEIEAAAARRRPRGGRSSEQRFTRGAARDGCAATPTARSTAAEVKVELTCETPDHLQTPLEPHAAVAALGRGPAHRLDLDAGDVRRAAGARGALRARKRAGAGDLGVHRRRVRREAGRRRRGAPRGRAGPRQRVAPCGSSTTGTRSSSTAAGGPGRARRVTLGARRDGTLVGVEVEPSSRMGAAGWIFPVAGAGAVALRLRRTSRAMIFPLKTNLRAQNAFRAPGVVEGTTVLEQAIDELALALEIDPLELRRANHVDARPASSNLPTRASDCSPATTAPPSSRAGRSATGCASRSADGLLRGMGCATQIWWGGGGPPSHATVRLDVAGRALVVTGIQDIGTGTLTSARLVAAEELGLPLDRVVARGGDTAPNLYGPVAGGSMTTPSVMPAVRSARREGPRARSSSSRRTCSRSPPATSRSPEAGSARATAPSTST